jgi:3-phenylpropionate/trans-cinnamate dioxygenase ferredoxin component
MVEFVKVASLPELPKGACKTVQANGKALALFNVDGTVFALDNTCRHHGGPLGEGTLEGEVVTCPWHMWQYNVRTGENVAECSIKVATYPVQVEGNDIKVAI